MEADYTAEKAPPKENRTRIPPIILKNKLSTRDSIHLLDEEKVEFYTYQLTAEKPVVIRGIPDEINTTDIKKDLEEKGFQINSIIRITVGKEKRLIPLVHVNIKKTSEASAFQKKLEPVMKNQRPTQIAISPPSPPPPTKSFAKVVATPSAPVHTTSQCK
ncbi:hypothetical protein ILUMI_16131 [Ignelater luminosus]|uniref:Pre-C2HC domain-containing protein n=1 Tax=Ignelater luminosus TaxID=2038154 RepID=A0A8K0CRL6_IGNLU|nr:hypothetical protein ILUMI_16131 [Ignelater luminosus]